MTTNVSQSFHAGGAGFAAGGWVLALAVGGVLLLAGVLPAGLLELLGYRRDAVVADLQVWRLLTAQALHLGWTHLLVNLAAWGLLCLLFLPRLSTGGLGLVLLGGLTGTAAGLIATPGVLWYAGFSGALHGVVAGGAILMFRPAGRGLATVLLIGLALKLVVDVVTGGNAASLPEGARVVHEAHIWGGAGGILAAIVHRWFTRRLPCV